MKLTETTARFANNPEYVRYESLLIKLAAAMAAGDEEFADILRDEMDEPEAHLSSAEILRLNGLSGDLYSLYDNELLEPFKGTPQEYASAVQVAYQSNDYISILKLLRKEQNSHDKAHVAFLRSLTYRRLGHTKAGILFLKKAIELAADRVAYTWLYFGFLMELNRFAEIEELATRVIDDEASSAELKIQAGATLNDMARKIPTYQSLPLHQLAERGVLEGLENLQSQGRVHLPFNVIVDGYIILGSIYHSLGKDAEAISALDKAIQLDPREEDAYGMRGLLLYDLNRDQSKQDLLKAIKLSEFSDRITQSSQFHIALCQMFMDDNNLVACQEYAERLLNITQVTVEVALAHEYLAISKFVLSGPSATVYEHFELAASLYPANAVLSDNLLVYQSIEQDTMQNATERKSVDVFSHGFFAKETLFHTKKDNASKLIAMAA